MSGRCKQCGACCRRLIIEIEHLDVVREPRLLGAAELYDGNGKVKFESNWEKRYLLACGESKLCPFLVNNKCSIYPTRPNACVFMEVGGEQCRIARGEQPIIIPKLPESLEK